jgi:hypothetical protein
VYAANPRVYGAHPRVYDANPRVYDANPRVYDANPRVYDANLPHDGASTCTLRHFPKNSSPHLRGVDRYTSKGTEEAGQIEPAPRPSTRSNPAGSSSLRSKEASSWQEV